MPRAPKVGYALAMDDVGGDMPRHDEDAESAPQQEHTGKTNIAQVFRREKKGRSPEMRRKITGNGE